MSEFEKDDEAKALAIRSDVTDAIDRLNFSDFLESVPPNREAVVVDLARHPPGVATPLLAQPDIEVFCPECDQFSRFRAVAREIMLVSPEARKDVIVEYGCIGCRSVQKIYSLRVRTPVQRDGQGWCMKYGEDPQYMWAQISPRLRKILGSEFEFFLRGRHCESHGLGVGAFSYYRRVVESQRGRIIDEFIKGARSIGVEADVIKYLEAAKRETQSSAALDALQGGIPSSLLIDGQNPLRLLYSALSEAIHNDTDEQCLQAAHDVRLVLTALAERLDTLTKDGREIHEAVTRLAERANSRHRAK